MTKSLVFKPISIFVPIFKTMIKTYLIIWCSLCLAACGPASADSSANSTIVDGAQLFKKHCVLCHGADGRLGLNGAKDLSQSTLSLEKRKILITHGKNLMTPFANVLAPSEIEAVANYTLSFNPEFSK